MRDDGHSILLFHLHDQFFYPDCKDQTRRGYPDAEQLSELFHVSCGTSAQYDMSVKADACPCKYHVKKPFAQRKAAPEGAACIICYGLLLGGGSGVHHAPQDGQHHRPFLRQNSHQPLKELGQSGLQSGHDLIPGLF